VFGNLDYEYAWDEHDTPAVRAAADPKRRRFQLADSMMHAWAAFARSGNPSVPTLPPWPAYDMQVRSTMILGDQSRIVADPRSEQRKVLRQVLG
jgi:para-nitrobenzyl esterase